MSLMASPSSFPSRNYKFNVFSSFHGPDVRKTLLSHMRVQYKRNGITMFDDQEIVRSTTIAPSLTEAIKESRISIVILSKKYASSSWCLDELVEILNCKEVMGQIVMTIFYGVEPSDVRKQTGEFGIAFNETCAHKTDEERQKWSKALNDVGNIAGEDFLRWDNEANMIKKLASDVSEKLNATPSRDFEDMVGIEAHLQKMQSLLHLDNKDEAMIVGISGPAGIGKTTIARALQSPLSDRFQLTCFVENIRGSYHSGLDDYGLQLRLQENLLLKVFNQDGTRICHLGVLQQRLSDLRVLIILDDVDDLKQLEALANETAWFGSGSRIVVTTENKELLQQHGINNTYHVGFPSDEEALEILCRYAFRQSFPPHGFKKLAKSITHLCGNLPLGLRVVGSSLRGKNERELESVMHKLETVLDRKIGDVLRVSYESLDEDEQTLFLHIAVFFNYEDDDLLKTMFADSDLDVKHGLKILVNRSLIEISTYKEHIVMHRLLEQVGRDAIHKQEPWKRKILMDAHEICDVLENETGSRVVSGISFDISKIDAVSIGNKAFKRMPNLRFLRVYKSKDDEDDKNDMIHIPEEMEFPRRLRLLHWLEYPNKCLPPEFHPEYLVELYMQSSQLEYLWQGTQPLTNLKKINLEGSSELKELPDLSNATNLEELDLSYCESLVEITSSFPHVHKLHELLMLGCINLQVIPAHLELASIKFVYIGGCSKLRNFPLISTHIRDLSISKTAIEDPPASSKLKGLTHLPTSSIKIHLKSLDLRNTDIERIPDCIKALHSLRSLYLSGCRRLASLPELPSSLRNLYANDCESLETVFFPLNKLYKELCFTNCFKLDQQTQRAIIYEGKTWLCRGYTWLPGREVPAEFDHRARGNSLTIRFDENRPLLVTLMFCLVISPNNQINECSSDSVLRRRIVNGVLDPNDVELCGSPGSKYRTEHLFIFTFFHYNFDEVVYEFRSKDHGLDIVEFGARILEDDTDLDIVEWGAQILSPEIFQNSIQSEPLEDDTEDGDRTYEEICDSKEEEDLRGETHTDCWSWLFFCFNLSDFVRNIRSLVLGKKTIEARAQSPSLSSPLAISSQSW